MTENSTTSIAGKNLTDALNAGVSITTGAVSNTLNITKNAMDQASKVAGTTVNAAGVLGESTVNAATTIGKSAIDASGKLSAKGITTTADIGSKTLSTTGKITEVGLTATEDVAKAAGDITGAAAGATSEIATTALDTTSSVVTTTTEQVGNSLNAAVNLVGNAVTFTAKGVDNINKLIAGRGDIIAQKGLQKQGAEVQKIAAQEGTINKSELLKAFDLLEKQLNATVTLMHGVQKTALAAQINIYKRAKCGFFRRMTGFCDAGTISRDMSLADIYLKELRQEIQTAGATAKTAITTASESDIVTYKKIEINFSTTAANAVNKFVQNYKILLDKYNKLALDALGPKGGRRVRTKRRARRHRKTYRKH
jgi:hypothetical protein